MDGWKPGWNTLVSNDDLIAWGTAAALLVSIVALIAESRRSRFSLRVDVLLQFEQRFLDKPMRAVRRRAAAGLLSGDLQPADEVLDFFEMLGLMLRRKAVDREMAWHAFYKWVDGYCQAAGSYIAESQEEDDTVWTELSFLHKELQHQEAGRSRIPLASLAMSPEAIKDFLDEEASLR